MGGIVERFDTKTIPDSDEAVGPLVGDDYRKLAPQVGNRVQALVFIETKYLLKDRQPLFE